MSEQPDTTDDGADSRLPLTRRQTLGALAAAGVLGASAVGQEEDSELLNAGGGPMSDAQDQFRVQRYRGTFDERPDAGIARRVWEVDDPGHENHGAIYVDDGESWELVDRKVGSLHAEELNNAIFTSSVGGVTEATDNADPGQTIVVDGVHEESVKLRTENITLLDGGGLIRTPEGAAGDHPDDGAIRVLADGISIIGVEIDGNADNLGWDGDDREETRYADGIGIYADNFEIRGCTIRDTLGHGIIPWNEPYPDPDRFDDVEEDDVEVEARPSRDGKIIDNWIFDCKDRTGIDVASTNNDADNCSNITVRGNHIIGGEDGPTDFHGVTVHTGEQITISDNHIRVPGRGLNLHSGAEEILCTGNDVESYRRFALRVNEGSIRINGGIYRSMEDICVISEGDDQITVQNAELIGDADGEDTVNSEGDFDLIELDDCKIINNGGRSGVNLTDGGEARVTDCDIVARRGIRLGDNNKSISNNNTVKVDDYGIRHDGINEISIIDNNTVVLRDDEDLVAIWVISDDSRSFGNRIYDADVGVELDGEPDSVEVIHNRFQNVGPDIKGDSGADSETSPNFSV